MMPSDASTPAADKRVQGLGRHPLDYVMERFEEELAALNTILACSNGPYLTGATPCQADCFLFGILEQVRSLSSFAV